MNLPIRTVAKIEGLLEEGYFVQLEEVNGDLVINKRPKEEVYIYCTPTCLSWDDKAVVVITVRKVGEDPAMIATFSIPERFYLLALHGAVAPEVKE